MNERELAVWSVAVGRWLRCHPLVEAGPSVRASQALADLAADPARASGFTPPQRIVYVSCNPATLARDAGLLVHQAGYRCTAAGAINMFPHTAHVERMAVFEKG